VYVSVADVVVLAGVGPSCALIVSTAALLLALVAADEDVYVIDTFPELLAVKAVGVPVSAVPPTVADPAGAAPDVNDR
jgi:hypothetical protein